MTVINLEPSMRLVQRGTLIGRAHACTWDLHRVGKRGWVGIHRETGEFSPERSSRRGLERLLDRRGGR